jgi:glutamyl-tRNA(Gln) amidotransferase subunit E
MNDTDSRENHERTRRLIRYVSRKEASRDRYEELGFRCGLEVHQQLKTEKKLFCRCSAGRYQDGDDYDAHLVRHMRPTLSELGEYDGTALMEFRTKKNIVYRIKGETACTYDIDDTPPFPLNREALRIALEIAVLLETNIVGELHITRKQYLDGSIPTGFQRTAIVGIDGEIPLSNKIVRILQLSVEEDSCREVSDVGHVRTYTTDRLGIPLVETVTYHDMATPDEAREAANYIRFLTRSTGKVNVGIGAARQDVNVSIEGGTRVEIKGVQHIRWIPDLTHNEAFRQRALLAIRDELTSRVADPSTWSIRHVRLAADAVPGAVPALSDRQEIDFVAINLPAFCELLSFFTSPNRCFADELSDRVKVVACIEKPNMTHTEARHSQLGGEAWERLRGLLDADPEDAQILLWGPSADIHTAIQTIEERCRFAFEGVPNETRKALADGTTVFERVLPGPDRMYPDTDSAPIPIEEAMIEAARQDLPESIARQRKRLTTWRIPEDTHTYILRRNLFPALRWMIEQESLDPPFAGTLLGHTVRNTCRGEEVDTDRVMWVVQETRKRGLVREILRTLLPAALRQYAATFDELLGIVGYVPQSESQLIARVADLQTRFSARADDGRRIVDWIMGQLRTSALGNVSLAHLASRVQEAAK